LQALVLQLVLEVSAQLAQVLWLSLRALRMLMLLSVVAFLLLLLA
jgi:hypothetical protein